MSATEENVRKLERLLDDNPMRYTGLFKASRLKKGAFIYARRVACRDRRIIKDSESGLYCIPGQERMAFEKSEIGAIGNRQKLVLVKEAFHEIFMLRMTDDKDGKWKSARRIAERIEPIMDDAKRRDSDFPYVPGLHRVFEYPPDAFVPVSDGSDKPINWQRYCAEVMEYCDRRLGRY